MMSSFSSYTDTKCFVYIVFCITLHYYCFHFDIKCVVCVCAAAGVKGRTISLKLKRRKTNAPDPPKFMGHGDCDNMSRSITLSRFTDSPAELASQGKALLKALNVNPTQIRGIGLNVSLSAFCSLLQAHKFRLGLTQNV